MAGWGGCREGLSLCPLPFGRARAGDAAKGAGQGRGTIVADLVGDQRQGAALLQALMRTRANHQHEARLDQVPPLAPCGFEAQASAAQQMDLARTYRPRALALAEVRSMTRSWRDA